MRMRRKRRLDSRMMSCGHLLVPEPEMFCGCWLEEFSSDGLLSEELRYEELHIELGCGKGIFTVETAKKMPKSLILGLEKISNVLVVAMERAGEENIKNVRFINRLADDLTSFFAESEISRIYINFCDPWPANRHKKRRLTGQQFLEKYKRVLKPNGEIHFKTDNLPLFEFSLEELEKNGFTLSEVSYNLHEFKPAGVMTDYEMKFYEQGIKINRCVAAIS